MTAELSLLSWAREAEAAAGIARALAPTAFIPDSLKIRDGNGRLDLDGTVATVSAALLTGQELGLGPMAALRSIDVIRGTPALRAATLRALVQRQGHSIVVIESTATRAVVRARRAGTGETMEATWTLDRAERMKIAGYHSPDGQWRRQPQNMLLARATAEAARWVAADAILGLPYIAEEIGDDGSTDAGPEPTSTPGPVPPKAAKSSKARRPGPPALPSGPLPPPPPPSRGETEAPAAGPGGVTEDAQATPGTHATDPPGPASEEPGPATADDMITAAQRARLWAGLKSLGYTDRDVALGMVAQWTGREVSSTNDLTRVEAARALDALTAAQRHAEQEEQ